MKKNILFIFISNFILAISMAFAAEIPIGQAIEKNSMQISAVYLQAVTMQHKLPAEKVHPDIHLELDVRALKNNPNGFAVGEWIPYLQIAYHLEKEGTTWHQTGNLLPMIASDGPHYGLNVSLNGPGKYKLFYHINPPNWSGFYRHTDKETGVGDWWLPFDVDYTFTYVGTGKKGGY